MNIALCDDDGRFRAQTARSLEGILEKRGRKADVVKFSNAESLLEVVEAGAAFDLYLLDIVMPGMDGVTLARHLRKRFPSVPILFFTTSSDFAVEAFALGAAHYVVKPFSREQFVAAIDRALALASKSTASSIVLKTADGYLSVPIDEIIFSETYGHYQLVRLRNGKELVERMSGQLLWQRLEPSERFVRAGLRFIFNLAHITCVGKNEVTLTGGRTVSVPRRTMPDLKAAYLSYCCH